MCPCVGDAMSALEASAVRGSVATCRHVAARDCMLLLLLLRPPLALTRVDGGVHRVTVKESGTSVCASRWLPRVAPAERPLPPRALTADVLDDEGREEEEEMEAEEGMRGNSGESD